MSPSFLDKHTSISSDYTYKIQATACTVDNFANYNTFKASYNILSWFNELSYNTLDSCDLDIVWPLEESLEW